MSLDSATQKSMKIRRRPKSDQRPIEEIQKHYEIEKELASRLHNAPREERMRLYTSLYDELCERVPNIPGWNEPPPPEVLKRNVAGKVKFLKNYVTSDSTFLELGPGDCSVSLAVAEYAKQVYAVDVSEAITSKVDPPGNFKLVISDGVSVDVPPASVDVAYSNQLMEHLHPDDALEQLQNLARALKPGGVYICITPSKLSGPHDVSKYFDETPTGLHLREYSTTELARIFKQAGFARVSPFISIKQKFTTYPLFFVTTLEALLGCLPGSPRRAICNRFPVSHILGRVVARMPRSRST